MYTVLTFQVAVGIITGNLDGTSLDTCLVSFLQVGDGGLIAVSLGIAQIHTHQHACPVLALRTTGTRVNFQHTVHLIGFLAKHILEFEGLDSSDCLGIGIVHFLFSHQFVFVKVESQLYLVSQGLYLIVAGNPLLQAFHFLHLSLGSLLVVPETGSLGAELLFFHLYLLSFNVQIAVQRLGTFFDIFQLFCGNHICIYNLGSAKV